MFESLLSNFLSSRLTQFVKHIDTENLKVGIWKGEVVLEDLELRSDCFEGLDAPFFLRGGYIGNLRIKIPWNSLTSKPVVIELEKIHLILHPVEGTTYKPDANYAALSKQASIAAAELAKRANVHASTNWRSNLLSRLLTRIIGSIQIRVLDIHARVEIGSGIIGATSFAAGALIQEISSSTGSFAEKKFQVKGLSAYWDRDVEPISCTEMGIGDLTALFADWGSNVEESSASSSVHEDDDGDIFFVARSEDEGSAHQFLLHPLDLSLALRVLTPSVPEASTEAEKPKYEADVAMKAVRVSLEVGQMWDMLRLADWLQVSELRKSFGNLRPDSKICESPILWWRYAISAVICQTKANSSTWAWSELKTLCANRREYSRLYRLMLSGKASSLERLQLASLEGQLPVEQIMFSRAIAEDQIGKAQMQSSGERSWFRWGLRRVMSPQAGGQGDVGDLEVEFTPEEEDFLSNALEIPEHASEVEQLSAGVPSLSVARDIPADSSSAQSNDHSSGRPNPDLNAATTRWSQRKKSRRLGKVHGVSCEIARNLAITWFDRPRNPNSVIAIADVSLSELTITLAVRLPDNGNENLTCNFYNIQEIITASLSEISLRVNSGTEETKITAKLCQISVQDMLTQGSAFPSLISSEFPAVLKDDDQNSILGKTSSVNSQHPPAVDCEIFIRGDATNIQVKIQPLEIVALPECLYALGAYFIPEYEAPFYENQVIAALNSIDDCAGRIQAKLAFLVEKMSHQVTFEVRAEKPRLIIPGDVLCADTAMIFCVDTLMIESSPYSWHESTQRAISAAAKELQSCAEACERQKQMQRMFFGELALKLSGVRLFIADAVPAANFSFIAYRLANALKAKGNSKGITPSNPQFSRVSNDVLLPMDLHISVLLSLLRSDASMPLVYLKTHIKNLTFQSDLNFLARTLSILQSCSQVSPQYLDLRHRIKEQACRANMGKSCCPSTNRHQILRKKEGLPTAAAAVIAETQSEGNKEDPDNSVVGKDDIETSTERNLKKHASPQPIDDDSIGQVSEAASGDANGHFQNLQEATTQAQLAEAECQNGAGSIRADEAQKSRWWVRQWLNAGSRNQQTVAARALARLPSSPSEVQGIPQSPNDPSQASSDRQTSKSEDPILDKISKDIIVKESCKNPGSIPLLPSKEVFKTSKVNEVLVDSNEEQQSCAMPGDSVDIMKSDQKGGVLPNRRWFQWSKPAQANQESLAASGKSPKQSTTLESKERPGSSLLNRLKFLYPVVLQGALQESESSGDADNMSRQRVVNLPASTKTEAFLLVKSRGQRWEALSWKEKLRACLEVGGSDANRPSESGCTSRDLPRLREQFSSSFIAANLDEISPHDAVHLEAELSICTTSILVCENQSDNDTPLGTLHEQTMGVALQLLPSPSQALQTTSFSAGVVLRRHGVNFQSKVDDLVLYCGPKDRVATFSADSCIISSRESGPENVLGLHSGPWAKIDALKIIESGPFLQSKISYFEDGYTLQDGIRLSMSSHLRSLAAQFGLAEYKCIYSLATQLSNIVQVGESAIDVHTPTNDSGVEKSNVIPSKLFLAVGIATVALEDALSKHNWSKLTIRGLQCVIDSGHSAEKLAEISLGYFGVYSSENDKESWETVLSPENDGFCKSIFAFNLILQRTDENLARLESYRKSSKALGLQQVIRCVPNLIQDQKLNLRSQLQDRKIDFRTQKRCVSGNSVVSFLVDHGFADDKEEGTKLGQLLIDQGLMHKVPDHGKFEDCSALYRFFIDEEEINVRTVLTESHPEFLPKDITKDRFFLSATIMALRINVYHSFCDTVLHTISILDNFHSQNKPSSCQRSEDTKILPEAILKQDLTSFLETLDVHLTSAGLTCHVPALKGSYSILGGYKDISLISNYHNGWEEYAREENTTLRPGLDASCRNTGTSSFETFVWAGSKAHKFSFKINGCMFTGQGKSTERLIDSFDLQIEMCTRPNGIVTVDTTISPGLRVNLDEDFLINLADAFNHACEVSSKSSGPYVTQSIDPNVPVLQSFFSGGYGFKLDCGGLDLTLPCYPVDDRFRLKVKPLCCTFQMLFKDSALLPLDVIKCRAAFKPRESSGGSRDCSLVRSILDRVATVDMGVLVDDLVLDTTDTVLFRGQSAAVRTCLDSPSVARTGLESQDEPESGRRTRGTGDDWRLLRFAAVWRPGASGGDVTLDCRVGGFLLRHDSTAASALLCRLSWFSALLCNQSSVDGKRRPQTPCGFGSESVGRSRDQPGPLVRGQGLPNKAREGFESRGSGRAARAHGGAASLGAEASPSKFGGRTRDTAEPKAGARCTSDLWAEVVPGRCEVRLSTGEWQLLSGPQRICGSTAQYLCLASRFSIHIAADNCSEGAGQARRLTTDLDMGFALCWCDLRAAGVLPYPATSGPCLVPSHVLFHLPSIAFHLLLAGPGASCDWTGVLRDGGGMKATVECEMGSVVEARGSFADLAGVEAAVIDTVAALGPLTTAESRDSRAGDGPASPRAVEGVQRATSSGAPHLSTGQVDVPHGMREAGAGSNSVKTGEYPPGALVVASMLSCLSVRLAGVRLVLAECRRAGPAGGTLRLPLLDVRVGGVEGKLEATERMGVRCSAAGYASCDYLNRGLGQWEPLLERWSCDVTAKTDVALEDLVRGVRSRVDVEVASGDHLNINVSRAMLDVAMGVLAKDAKEWWTSLSSPRAGSAKHSLLMGSAEIESKTRDKEADAAERASDADAFHPLWIKNETGQRIVLEAQPLPMAARAAVVEPQPPCSPTCPSRPMAPAGQPRFPGAGGAWQQVEAGGMHPVTCVPLVSTPATGAGPGLPQVSLRQLRVYLAHPEPASPPGAGSGPSDSADVAPGPAWDDPAPNATPPATRPPSSSRARAAADRVLDTGRMLQGSIDLDLPGRQAS